MSFIDKWDKPRITRAAEFTVSTCPKGVNLNNLVAGRRGLCRARLRMAHAFNRVSNAPRFVFQIEQARPAGHAVKRAGVKCLAPLSGPSWAGLG